jgi:hypothetical protein
MIQDARYTSPSGKETAFEWESGKRKTELKTGIFTFPGRDGAHVQHQGAGARSFSLVCIFSGENYMEKADAFEEMLIERGAGELQHPVYGTVKVVPTGDIERDDDPVNRIGESAVSITFVETIVDEETGDLTAVAAGEIDRKFDEFADAAAADFADALDIEDAAAQAAIVSALDAQTAEITKNLEPLAGADKKNYADWLAAGKEIKDNIADLYKKGMKAAGKAEGYYVKALNTARLTLRLMKLPSALSVNFAEKMKGFAALTVNLINQYKIDPLGIEKMKAAYASASLALAGACAAAASGTALAMAEIAAMPGVMPGTMSRENAAETAAQIAAFFETVKNFQSEKIEKMTKENIAGSGLLKKQYIDADPAAHIALEELVQASIQLILNASFALPMQKTITLDRDRQVVELCAGLYGDTDMLDDFIIQNNFNIDEIELLPMGRKVLYYVKSV